jgi:hypothetical protein
MDEIIGGWRRVCSEELCKLYSSPKCIRMIKSTEDKIRRACSTHDREEEFMQDFGRRMDEEETTRKKQTYMV